jgi:hypothetical protein
MPRPLPRVSLSLATRFLLAALGLTLLALGLSAFLAALLSAAADAAGKAVFSSLSAGLTVLLACETIALLVVLALRMEFAASGSPLQGLVSLDCCSETPVSRPQDRPQTFSSRPSLNTQDC